MRKQILDLSHSEAKKFFLRQDSYITLELPKYFEFEKVLSTVNNLFKNQVLSFFEILEAKKIENVNYVIYGNKDGKYAWRKFDFINPLIYISLVNVITNKENWNLISQRLKKLNSNPSIKCFSIPVLPDQGAIQKATQINEWVNEIEKESIRLALKFEYIYHTDISNCYGSIYTHSLGWAIHEKEVSKNKRKYEELCGNMIDHHLQAMSNGQTNGLPQGSILMDFLAELVLAYADYELSKKLNERIEPGSFHILRYRDDYRIFVRDQITGERIIKAISEVLMALGMQLNIYKTTNSADIISSSIKPDKRESFDHIVMTEPSKKNLLEELLLIHRLGKAYPNCGAVTKRLARLYRIYELLGNQYYQDQEIELISILSNIGIDNPKSIPNVTAIISKVLSNLNNKDKSEIVISLFRKFKLIPNSGLLEIWLQRISVPNEISVQYIETICRMVENNKLHLFDTTWIKDKKIINIINDANHINDTKLKNIDTIISRDEVSFFNEDYD